MAVFDPVRSVARQPRPFNLGATWHAHWWDCGLGLLLFGRWHIAGQQLYTV